MRRHAMLDHLRILTPHPNILAFYDGRVDGFRVAETPNWIDDGAIGLGIASYAIIDGPDALVYDTHVSIAHARAIRAALAARGVRNMTVVLSHWHLDHIAGTAVFADCEVIASARTADCLMRHRAAIETGTTSDGPPAIVPLQMPTRTYERRMTLAVGAVAVELIHFNIHSDDATVLWLPSAGVLLAGDTLEDTITYVAEPQNLAEHVADLGRMAELAPRRILPCHGDPEIIASGGYDARFIAANARYVRTLMAMKLDVPLRRTPLRQLIAAELNSGALTYHPGYEAVHASNLKMVLG
ncbi:MAG: MBL fold metallo-hydrolase [Hyphomicrobium sp.]